MDDADPTKPDHERLDHLEEEIKAARHHLNERTHQEEDEPLFFEDDQKTEEQPA